MRIERITVHGFRNIKNTSLHFDKILALVSLNSFGKSNLINAINFGVSFITNDSKKSMMHWTSGVPVNKKLDKEDFSFELEMTTSDENLGEISAIYGFKFRWVKNDETGGRIIAEWLKIKSNEKGQKYSQYISRDTEKSTYKKSDTGRCDYIIKVEPDELIINKLKAFDNLFFLDTIKKINNLSVHIERHLDAESAYEQIPFVRTDLEALQIDNIENLPRILFNLKNNQETVGKYELLVNSYRKLFPHIEKLDVAQATFKSDYDFNIPADLPLRLANEIYILRVTDKNLNQPINFVNMSDGAKRILLLLTCIILSDHNKISLVAIEEPENCIHPSLLQSFLIIISQLTESCRVIFTSHSPYLTQYIDLSNIYIGVPRNDGIAHFEAIRSSYQKLLMKDAYSSGKTTGEYIFNLMSYYDEGIGELNKYLECDIQ